MKGDVELAQATLRKYLATAEKRGNPEAIAEVKNVMRVLNRIYPIYHEAVMNVRTDNLQIEKKELMPQITEGQNEK